MNNILYVLYIYIICIFLILVRPFKISKHNNSLFIVFQDSIYLQYL